MSKFPYTYAWNTGRMLSEKWADIRFVRSEESTRDGGLTKDEQPPTEDVYGRCEIGSDGRLIAHYHREEIFGSFDDMTKLWFALFDGGHLNPPHLALLGYADGRFPTGTVLTEDQFAEVGLNKEDLMSFVAKITWRKGDPIVQQIYTHPEWRRKRVMIAMFGVADLMNSCGQYSPGKLIYGGEITTEDGEKMREAFDGSSRIVPRIGSFDDQS
jgi:hypothetical protein